MKKLLYIAPVYIDFQKLDGVAKKVLDHFHVFEKHYSSILVSYGPEGIQIVECGEQITNFPYGKKHRRFSLYSFVEKLSEKEKFDYVYIRYPMSEKNFIRLVKVIKNNGSKIVVEIPTYPYKGIMFASIKSFIISVVDSVFKNQLAKYVDRIVTYSNDSSIFEIKTLKTLNGIDFDRVDLRNGIKKEHNTIDLIAVAMLWPCHGYDRIIEGLKNYYQDGGQENIVFHIVGEGPVIPEYKSLISDYQLQKHILLHGFQTGNALDELYEKAELAVNSLAIHRLNLTSESTLKTKEYAAKGLPIISSYYVDAFDQKGNQDYILRVSGDETPVDIQAIIDFYKTIYGKNENYELPSQVREAARKNCDMGITLKPIINYFGSENLYES